MFYNIRKELIFLVLSAPSSEPFTLSTAKHLAFRAVASASSTSSSLSSSNNMSSDKEYYRADGVRMDFDPYAPRMAEKYGLPGATDNDGFDPYSDSVGAGIYGGSVKRDANGNIVIGQQYQNHNERPGPVYDETGYTLMSKAIQAGHNKVKEVLKDFPELKDEISTGGARPLHVCGMSKTGQLVLTP